MLDHVCPFWNQPLTCPWLLWILVGSILCLAGSCWPRTPQLITSTLFSPIAHTFCLPSHNFQPEDQPSLPLVPRMRVVRGRHARGGAWSCLFLPHQNKEMRERRAGVGTGPGRAGQVPSATCHWAPALGSLHGCPWQHLLGPSFQLTSSPWAEDSTCLHRCLRSAFSCWATCSHSVTPIWFFTRTFGSNFSSSHCRVSVFPAALLDCSLPLPESGILLGQQRISGVGGSCGSLGQLVKPPTPPPTSCLPQGTWSLQLLSWGAPASAHMDPRFPPLPAQGTQLPGRASFLAL